MSSVKVMLGTMLVALGVAGCSEGETPVMMDGMSTGDAPWDSTTDGIQDSLICGGQVCDDGLSCTQDSCKSGLCDYKLLDGHCVIGGICYKDGETISSGSCRRCDPKKDKKNWTEDASLCTDDGLSCTQAVCTEGKCSHELQSDACYISSVCYKSGEANPQNGCQVCTPSKSTSAFTTLAEGASCTSDNLSCTDDMCKGGQCTHGLKVGLCLIQSTCYLNGQLNPSSSCQSCQPDKTQTAWTSETDGTSCTDDGLTCTGDTCKAGACVHSVQSGACVISNTCYKSGDASPSSDCQQCDPAKSTTAWSNKTDGSACTADAYTCTADVCSAGKCTHTLSSGYCLIGGQCYSSGAKHPTIDCSGCNPATSTTSWSILPDGTTCTADAYTCTDDLCESGACNHSTKAGTCLIQNVCYSQGASDPSQDCRICDSSASTTSWSTAANGTACTADAYTCTSDICQGGSCTHSLMSGYCQIGGTCYTNGQINPSAPCTYCSSNDSTSSWSNFPQNTGCSGGKCDGNGYCCTGCLSASTCMAGTSAGACGAAGNPCTSCAVGYTCTGGSCVSTSAPDAGCNAVSTAGCGGCACETCVCAIDSYCCSTNWDSLCANECKQCNTDKGCSANPTGVTCTGCGGCTCETCVCAMDSYCCSTNWDSLCADECKNDCGGACP